MTSEKSPGGGEKRPPAGSRPRLTPEQRAAFFKRLGVPDPEEQPPPAAPRLPLTPERRAALFKNLPAPDPQEQPPPARSYPGAFSRRTPLQFGEALAARSPTPRTINLARCHVTELRELGEIERFLSEERKTYPNNSKSATVTKELSVSNSIVRTVTIEASKLKAHNADASVTLFGFASIQGTVQQQLNQRYSVTMQSSVSISEKTTIQLPPNTVVEHVIQWKLVSINGLAFLGASGPSPSSLILAEVPYQVPLRLTYTETVNDIKKIPKTSG